MLRKKCFSCFNSQHQRTVLTPGLNNNKVWAVYGWHWLLSFPPASNWWEMLVKERKQTCILWNNQTKPWCLHVGAQCSKASWENRLSGFENKVEKKKSPTGLPFQACFGTSSSQELKLSHMECTNIITRQTQSHSTCNPPDTDTSTPNLMGTAVSSVVGSLHCVIASSTGSNSITPGSSPQQNWPATQEKTNVRSSLFSMEAREKKKIPFGDSKWDATLIMGAPISWLTSQEKMNFFCRAI